jgi:hypothetical protein
MCYPLYYPLCVPILITLPRGRGELTALWKTYPWPKTWSVPNPVNLLTNQTWWKGKDYERFIPFSMHFFYKMLNPKNFKTKWLEFLLIQNSGDLTYFYKMWGKLQDIWEIEVQVIK